MTAENCPHSLYEQQHTHRRSKHILANNLYEHAVKFVPFQLVLGLDKVSLAENVPCMEKKANPLQSFH